MRGTDFCLEYIWYFVSFCFLIIYFLRYDMIVFIYIYIYTLAVYTIWSGIMRKLYAIYVPKQLGCWLPAEDIPRIVKEAIPKLCLDAVLPFIYQLAARLDMKDISWLFEEKKTFHPPWWAFDGNLSQELVSFWNVRRHHFNKPWMICYFAWHRKVLPPYGHWSLCAMAPMCPSSSDVEHGGRWETF